MTSLTMRIADDVKAALAALGDGNITDGTRDALRAHAVAATLAQASGLPIGLVRLVLDVNAAVESDDDTDVRCEATAFNVRCAVAFDAARQGNTQEARALFGRVPRAVKQRAAAMAAALERF